MSDNKQVRYYSGLDVGGVQEFTALAVLEKTTQPDPASPEREASHFAVRHLERFPLGTPYTEVCEQLRERFSQSPLRDSLVTVDLTGVGKPVFQLLRKARVGARLSPLLITAGHKAALDCGTWRVPKVELISTLQILLMTRRLKVAPELPEAQTLVEELMKFKMKVTVSDKEESLSWRERPYDDLVLATAIAAWQAQRCHDFRLWVL